ncbi:MAG TPA: tRNA (adenosine(37)-N6)-threonylcarbamoyltransferase complex dimerization subunit type 1 TsaB [Acidimicrobiales bacterium]|nr:tRNA (adenosine(37)-N6)-threonylcarbamoyltransferase complex dimerization subunit type 1 TsaB [Acidimicrobiales bacterium]
MILLGIESATELVGVAVADDDGPRAGVWAAGRRRHGESLAPAVAHALEQAQVGLDDVGAIAVDVGPGLFTGLRVGVATAKGLAQGLGVGVVALTSVEVLARAAADAGWQGTVVAVIDARRGEVFAARYRSDARATGPLSEVSPPTRFQPEELAKELAGVGEPLLAVGDGARRYAADLEPVAGLVLAGPSLAWPPPATLVALAGERLAGGAVPQPPSAVLPTYLREADARINWSQRRSVPPGR